MFWVFSPSRCMFTQSTSCLGFAWSVGWAMVTSSRLILPSNIQKQKRLKLSVQPESERKGKTKKKLFLLMFVTYCEYSYVFTFIHVNNTLTCWAYWHVQWNRYLHAIFFFSSSNLYKSCYTSRTSWCWLKIYGALKQNVHSFYLPCDFWSFIFSLVMFSKLLFSITMAKSIWVFTLKQKKKSLYKHIIERVGF